MLWNKDNPVMTYKGITSSTDPPFLGCVIGVVGFHVMAFVVFKAIGG